MISAIEAESAVAGAILLDDRCLPEITAILTEDDFAIEANRAIFRAAVALSRKGEVVDPVTIRSEAGGAISAEYMMELMSVTTTAANAGVYAAETRKASMLRAIRDVADDIASRASGPDNPRELIADAVRAIESIEAQDTSNELASPTDALLAFYEHRRRIDSGEGGFVPTGYTQLDKMLGGGLLSGGLYVMAARPGMGKTTFALNVADNIAEGGPVLFVSLEMDRSQLVAKRLARLTGVPSDKLMMGRLLDCESGRVAQCASQLDRVPMYINRKPFATVADIESMARKVRGLRCVVVDYFGLIRPTGQAAKRYEAMTEISGALKAMARTLGVPMLCLAQLNRENMQRTGNKPRLSDLRDTGALEQDADGVIFLHRPDYYDDGEGGASERMPFEPVALEIILSKNRHSGTGICHAGFFMDISKIVQITTSGG